MSVPSIKKPAPPGRDVDSIGTAYAEVARIIRQSVFETWFGFACREARQECRPRCRARAARSRIHRATETIQRPDRRIEPNPRPPMTSFFFPTIPSGLPTRVAATPLRQGPLEPGMLYAS